MGLRRGRRHIYICAVGSISGQHLGLFRVNKWATAGSISGAHHFPPIKQVISEDFCKSSFQRGVQSSRRLLVFWSKNRLLKKGMLAIPLFAFLFWWLLVDVTTRWWERGWPKKSYKTRFSFCHPLLERRKRGKRRESLEVKKHHHFYTIFEGLKSVQEVVPPFWPPKFQRLLSAKKPSS